jgi:hypothetical protein
LYDISVADPGCFIPDPDPYILHPESWGQKSTGSQILLCIKRGMKNKTNLFLAPYGFRDKFISKKIKEQEFLRKSHQTTYRYPLDPRSEIRDPC